ncbi:hypothetical protein GCM10023322_16480 [Rugosimonospora acidiphila]|uniref:Uncharacterized protein n=1 Tax=Rugosimonospora acidiphila TaxID=556531 RepID=A0ABP9RMP9_9ACTN
MPLSLALPALVGVGLLGFLAGLFVLRVKSRWCPRCGVTLRCPKCAGLRGVARRPGGAA